MERFGGLVAEQNLRCLDGVLQFGLAVDHAGNLLGQTFLQGACAGIFGLLCHKCVYLGLVENGENFDVFLGILVGYVEPELVEFVG